MDIIPVFEIKDLCQLVRSYTKDDITQEEYWTKRAEYFKQQDLLTEAVHVDH